MMPEERVHINNRTLRELNAPRLGVWRSAFGVHLRNLWIGIRHLGIASSADYADYAEDKHEIRSDER